MSNSSPDADVLLRPRRWTKDEQEQLLKRLAEGMSIESIATVHNRTETEIKSRQRVMAADMCTRQKMTVEQASERVRISVDQVKDALRRRDALYRDLDTRHTLARMYDMMADIRESIRRLEMRMDAGLPQEARMDALLPQEARMDAIAEK